MTPWLVLLAAVLAPAVPVIVSYILGGKRLARVSDASAEKVEQIHILVNSRMSEALDHIARLEARLADVGQRTDDLHSDEVRADLGRRTEDVQP